MRPPSVVDDPRFTQQVVTWLRTHRAIRLDPFAEPLQSHGGAHHLTGRLSIPKNVSRSASVSVAALGLAVLVALVGQRFGGRHVVGGIVLGLAATGVVALVDALMRWSHPQPSVRIAIVGQSAPLGPKRLAALWRGGRLSIVPQQLWVFARCGFSLTALAVAELDPIRCLVPDGEQFVEASSFAARRDPGGRVSRS